MKRHECGLRWLWRIFPCRACVRARALKSRRRAEAFALHVQQHRDAWARNLLLGQVQDRQTAHLALHQAFAQQLGSLPGLGLQQRAASIVGSYLGSGSGISGLL